MAQFKHMVLALTGLVLAPSFSFAQTYNTNTIGVAIMNLNAATLKDSHVYTMNDIWGRMRQDFSMTEVNPEIVRRQEQYYASKSAYFNRTVSRSQPYLYHILSEVEKRGMPAEIALLPFIESAYVTKAKSPVGASGLWQIMPATGRYYGLEQTNLYDGRHDIYAATDAALNYLQYLYGLFGDWSLALAAYNWGEGNVGKAVARAQAAGLDPVYENLRMPNETRNYVPKLLAVRNIINNPQAFGVNLIPVDNKPYFAAVSIDRPLDIQAAARLANISTQEFLTLNPSFNVPVFVPKENRKLLLPVGAVHTFENNYRKADKNSLLSWNLYTAITKTNLTDLAQQSGMSVDEIKRLNGLSGNTVAAGRSLLLSKNSLTSAGMMPFTQVDNDPLLRVAMTQPHLAAPLLAGKVQQAAVGGIGSQNVVMATPARSPQVVDIHQPVVIAGSTSGDIQASSQNVQATSPHISVAASTLNQPIFLTASAASAAVKPDSVASAKAAADNVSDSAPSASDNADVSVAAGSHADPLMDLAQTANMRLTAANAVQQAIAKADAEEARQVRLAEVRAERVARHTEEIQQEAKATTNMPETHKVVSGDTLFSIARRYNLNVADLVNANNLKGSNIHSGQILKVALNTPAHLARNTPHMAQSQVRPVSYTVKKGDTLSAIASRLNMPVSTLQKLNKNAALRPGQKIKLTNL